MTAPFRTTCPYCGVGCGVLATPDGKGGLGIKGDPDHPANRGRLCSKGSALGETLSTSGRALHPTVGGVRAGWEEATALVARRFSETIAEHGPDSVAFYVSGQLLTEDYYVANKLMKGFIGSANIDTNSRLCMASSVAGHKRAFGTDTVPGLYEDLEEAELIVFVGSNLAWCHPVLYQRILAARAARPQMQIVCIDPRRPASADQAWHLPIAPGGDIALFNGLLAEIDRRGAADAAWVAEHISGYDAALAAARATDTAATGLSPEALARFYALWIGTRKVVTIYSQGVNQSVQGTDKVNAILNCHLATGRIGRPGMGPFSVTGQPNAMGGREVGGLANMLACHLDIESPEHRAAVQDFWQAPTICATPGLKAVDMFRAVGDGRIKALWIMCTNPVVSLPEADRVAAAIRACPFVVVSDMYADTDTAKLAHVVLPAAGWAEKDGTVTNSERCISRQRGRLPPPGEARADWRIIADVGRAMGWNDAFGWQRPAQIFREYAAMSALAGQFGRDFDISGLAGLSDAEYDAFVPRHWPVGPARQGGRFFGDGRFFTPDGRGRMLAVTPAAEPRPGKGELRLNTGRVRDHWHSMTRTALAPRLSQHIAEPFVEMHPEDARACGLRPADLAVIENAHGRAVLRVAVSDAAARGSVFAPIHWTDQYAAAGRIDTLVPGNTDPVSGQPDSKAATVRIGKLAAGWHGFAVSLAEPHPATTYWAKARAGIGWRCELAGATPPPDWQAWARAVFGLPRAEVTSMEDPRRGLVRLAFLEEGRLSAALFIAPDPLPLARDHLAGELGCDADARILAGRPGADRPDQGRIVCACFNVGVNAIRDAIAAGAAMDVETIGRVLKAGTNCGSCKPDLRSVLEACQQKEPVP